MFGCNNTNPFLPVTVSERDDCRFHYDSSASTQLHLFGNTANARHNMDLNEADLFISKAEVNGGTIVKKLRLMSGTYIRKTSLRSIHYLFPAALDVNPTSYVGNSSVTALNQPNKRSREMEDMGSQHKLQISLNNLFQDEVSQSGNFPNPHAISTGLRLSYHDEENNSSVTSASGRMPPLPVLSSLSDKLRTEIVRQTEEFERYIKIQEQQMVKGVKEIKERHTTAFVNLVEEGVERKLREKELEIEDVNRKNRELVERIKQVALEAQSWQYRARYNEAVMNKLKSNLNQAIAQGPDQGREGCGDSEVDDAASNCNPKLFLSSLPQTVVAGGMRLSAQNMDCKSCQSKEICMLLIPCMHLSLCEDCVGFFDICPICQSAKKYSVQVYMS